MLEKYTGQLLNFCQPRNHPKISLIRNELLSNKMGRLFQGVVLGQNGKGQWVSGTDTFHVILLEDIPQDQHKYITYTYVVCEVISTK